MRHALILFALCCLAGVAHAQLTTGEIRGTVTAADDGQPMAEAEVTLVHQPTGYVKTTTTNTDGAFAFTGLEVGGPYRLTANIGGFAAEIEQPIGRPRSARLRAPHAGGERRQRVVAALLNRVF